MIASTVELLKPVAWRISARLRAPSRIACVTASIGRSACWGAGWGFAACRRHITTTSLHNNPQELERDDGKRPGNCYLSHHADKRPLPPDLSALCGQGSHAGRVRQEKEHIGPHGRKAVPA